MQPWTPWALYKPHARGRVSLFPHLLIGRPSDRAADWFSAQRSSRAVQKTKRLGKPSTRPGGDAEKPVPPTNASRHEPSMDWTDAQVHCPRTVAAPCIAPVPEAGRASFAARARSRSSTGSTAMTTRLWTSTGTKSWSLGRSTAATTQKWPVRWKTPRTRTSCARTPGPGPAAAPSTTCPNLAGGAGVETVHLAVVIVVRTSLLIPPAWISLARNLTQSHC